MRDTDPAQNRTVADAGRKNSAGVVCMEIASVAFSTTASNKVNRSQLTVSKDAHGIVRR